MLFVFMYSPLTPDQPPQRPLCLNTSRARFRAPSCKYTPNPTPHSYRHKADPTLTEAGPRGGEEEGEEEEPF